MSHGHVSAVTNMSYAILALDAYTILTGLPCQMRSMEGACAWAGRVHLQAARRSSRTSEYRETERSYTRRRAGRPHSGNTGTLAARSGIRRHRASLAKAPEGTHARGSTPPHRRRCPESTHRGEAHPIAAGSVSYPDSGSFGAVSAGARGIRRRGAAAWRAQGPAKAVYQRRAAGGGKRVDRCAVSACAGGLRVCAALRAGGL